MKALFLTMFLSLILLSNIAFAAQNTTIFCIDNSTLQENISVYSNSNLTNLTLNTWCKNGCDNITASCSPPKYEQVAWILGLFGLGLVGVAFVRRRV